MLVANLSMGRAHNPLVLPPLRAPALQDPADEGWSPGVPAPTGAPLGALSLEDLLVEVFAQLLNRESRGIAEDAAEIARAAEAYAESGDLSMLEGQALTEMRLALRERIKDREHMLSMVLAILESLNETVKKALDSLGK